MWAPGRARLRTSGWAASAILLVGAAVFGGLPSDAGAHPSALEQVEHLNHAIRARPDDPVNYIRRGQAFSDEGHFEEALADYQRAAGMGDPVAVAYDLGVLRYRMGELEAARAEFDRWLVRHPGHPQALEYRARVHRDAGQPQAALADYRAYFDAQQNPNPGDYVAAARLLLGLEEAGAVQALAMLDSGMARLGTIPQLQRPAIEILRERGDAAGAIARLETLRPSLGESPDWKIDMGELLLRQGRVRDATRLFDEAEARLDAAKQTAARQKLRERLAKLRSQSSSSTSFSIFSGVSTEP